MRRVAARAWLRGAFLVHTAALAVRSIGAGRLPFSNQYEFATSFAWGIALAYLIFARKRRYRALGTFVAPVIFLIIGVMTGGFDNAFANW